MTGTALLAPAIASVLAVAIGVWGTRGVDLAAHVYQVGLFHRQGLSLWDGQYGGHWTVGYSAIYAPIAGVLGVEVTAVASAAAAAWAFERLASNHFGAAARFGAVVFAVSLAGQVAVGQMPFVLGEALALSALLAASRQRRVLSLVLATLSSLASPLAGAFVVLTASVWLVTTWRDERGSKIGVCLASGLPLLVTAGLFPGQGAMPFPSTHLAMLLLTVVVLLAVLPADETALRLGALVYLVAIVANFFVPTALGGNIGRLGESVGAPIALCVMARHHRWRKALLLLPMFLMPLPPAWAGLTANRADPSTHADYFAPLLSFIGSHPLGDARLEVVPTSLHWEAVYVAPHVAMARGWERQLDTADNPIFYGSAPLRGAEYRQWLIANGVKYVALADVPLDYAAVQEGQLVASAPPGLPLVWHNAHWRVFEVDGSTGIVTGPAHLVRMDGSSIVLDVSARGVVVVRIRYSPNWRVTDGPGCVEEGPAESIVVDAAHAGAVTLQLRVLPTSHGAC